MDKFNELYKQFENSKWLINEKEIQVGKKLGDGASGVTYVGEYKGEKVAIKSYSVGILMNDINSVKNEMDILSKLSHENIVQFRGLMLKGMNDKPSASLITKFADRGELGDALYKTRLIKRKGNELRFRIVLGLAEGLKYLHSYNVIHRDIKPANILLNENCSPMLTDFGFSRFFDKDSNDNMTGETGSYRYMAPEVTSHIHYTEKADVYSFALICNEIFSDEKPFEYQIASVVALAVVQKNLRPSQKKIKNQTLKNIIAKCWSPDPNQRPEWDEIVQQLNVAKSEMIKKSSSSSSAAAAAAPSAAPSASSIDGGGAGHSGAASSNNQKKSRKSNPGASISSLFKKRRDKATNSADTNTNTNTNTNTKDNDNDNDKDDSNNNTTKSSGSDL